jgi:hypothetical protein
LLIFSYLKADVKSEFFNFLKNKNYENACRVGKKVILSNEKDEKLISLVAKSCLMCDYIHGSTLAQYKLRKTEEGRSDAVAFSSVLLQKKLVYQFMYDDTDISSFSLPIINHPLSYTFVAIRDKSYKLVSKSPKVIEFKVKEDLYKVFIDKNDKGRVIIEITDQNNNTQRRRYI